MINKDISQQELKTLRSPAPNMAVNIGGNFGEIKASFTIHESQWNHRPDAPFLPYWTGNRGS
jgi:hypothetical protein